MKVNDIPKYTSVETVMQLTRRQRQILYRQCKAGRSCYLVDVNYNTGGFYEDCFDYRGYFVGEHITHTYMSEEAKNDKEHKALEIIKEKRVDLDLLLRTFKFDNYELYNFEIGNGARSLTKEEHDLLKGCCYEKRQM